MGQPGERPLLLGEILELLLVGANPTDFDQLEDIGFALLFANAEYLTASPCAGLCNSPVNITSQFYNSGQLGSNATCHESRQPMTGFQCGNLSSSRTLTINGQPIACGQYIAVPEPRLGGYCIQTTAGLYDWAYFVTW